MTFSWTFKRDICVSAVVTAAATCAHIAPAMAQTCASPIPINVYTHVSTSTCVAPNSLPVMGGIATPHRDVVFKLTLPGLTGLPVFTFSADFNAVFMLLRSNCSVMSDPVAFAVPGQTLNIGSNLPPGEYYLVATADPDTPISTCGNIAVSGYLAADL